MIKILKRRSKSENNYKLFNNNKQNISEDRSLSNNDLREEGSRVCGTADSSSHTSVTDLRLSNLRSKLKAEVEEIRKWKEEANIKGKIETNANTTFLLNISPSRLNQSKIEQKLSSSENTSNSYSKYTAIRVTQFNQKINENEIVINCSSMESSSESKKCLNEQTTLLPKEFKIHRNIDRNNFIKNDFCNSVETVGDGSDKTHIKKKNCEISSTKLNEFFNINYSPEAKIEKQANIKGRNNYNYMENMFHDHESFEEDKKCIKRSLYIEDRTKMIKEIDYLKSFITQKDKELKDLQIHISKEIKNKENILEENVSLKKQKIELKYQMTHLLTVATASKEENINSREFSEYEEKIASITKKLKVLVNENKYIFQNIRDEMCNQNGKCYESIGNISFLEEKLNLKDFQFQNMRGQLEVLTTNYDQLQSSYKNINEHLTFQTDEIKREALQFAKKLDHQRNEISVLTEKNETMKSELQFKENIKLELRMIIDKQKLSIKELQQIKISLEENINNLKNKLIIISKEIIEKDKNILELQEFIKLTKMQCQNVNNRMKKMETEQKEYLLKKESEMRAIENKYIQENTDLKDKLNNISLELQQYSKTSIQSIEEKNKEIVNLENQLNGLKQQKKEMIEYLYKLPTSSIKWSHFFQ